MYNNGSIRSVKRSTMGILDTSWYYEWKFIVQICIVKGRSIEALPEILFVLQNNWKKPTSQIPNTTSWHVCRALQDYLPSSILPQKSEQYSPSVTSVPLHVDLCIRILNMHTCTIRTSMCYAYTYSNTLYTVHTYILNMNSCHVATLPLLFEYIIYAYTLGWKFQLATSWLGAKNFRSYPYDLKLPVVSSSTGL